MLNLIEKFIVINKIKIGKITSLKDIPIKYKDDTNVIFTLIDKYKENNNKIDEIIKSCNYKWINLIIDNYINDKNVMISIIRDGRLGFEQQKRLLIKYPDMINESNLILEILNDMPYLYNNLNSENKKIIINRLKIIDSKQFSSQIFSYIEDDIKIKMLSDFENKNDEIKSNLLKSIDYGALINMKSHQVLLNYDLSILPEEIQVKLVERYPNIILNLSRNAKKIYINNNPLNLNIFLDANNQIKKDLLNDEILNENDSLTFLELSSFNEKRVVLSQNYELITNIENRTNNPEILYLLGLQNIAISNRLDYDTVKKIIINKVDNIGIFNNSFLKSNDDSSERYWDIISINPTMINCSNNLSLTQIRTRLIDLFGTDELINYVNNLDKSDDIIKFISNNDIISKLSYNEIKDYILNPTHQKLESIVLKVYGEKALSIVEDRPNLLVTDIPNFYIFDSDILNNFNIGVIHSCFTYDSKIPVVLADMAKNKNLIYKFLRFNELFSDYFSNSVQEINDKLILFENTLELLSSLSLDNMSKEIKHKIVNFYKFQKANSNINISYPKNITELDEIINKVNVLYDENLDKMNAVCDEKIDKIDKMKEFEKKKNLISKRLFGSSCPFKKIYNFDYLKNNAVAYFNDEEMAVIDILSLYYEINDMNSLEQFYQKYKKLTMIDNFYMDNLIKKIKKFYTTKYVNQAIKVEDLKKLADDGNGVLYKKIDDVNVYTLNGADFTMIVHNPTLNCGGLNITNNNIPKRWKIMENGTSTISCTVINQTAVRKYSRANVVYGFSNITPEQIKFMYRDDAHTSHETKLLNPTGFKEFLAPEDLVSISDINGYNELVLNRTQENLMDVKKGTYGGKLIPDYMVCSDYKNIGEAIFNAKAMGINNVIFINSDVYEKKFNNINDEIESKCK